VQALIDKINHASLKQSPSRVIPMVRLTRGLIRTFRESAPPTPYEDGGPWDEKQEDEEPVRDKN
jgi:hypothetical protein